MELLVSLATLFRFIGDAAHVASMVVLVKKIRKTRSCSGLSFKTQILKMLVFLTRYLDLFSPKHFGFFTVYNTIMKILFLLFQSILLYTIRVSFFNTYEPSLDDLKIQFLIGPSAILAFFLMPVRKDNPVLEYFYCFSLLLECVAILPQLVQLQRMQESETLTSSYIFLLGIYRMFYTFNWALKKAAGVDVNQLLMATGVIQVFLYLHFFHMFYGYIVKSRGFKTIRK